MKYTEVVGIDHDFLGSFNKEDVDRSRTIRRYKELMNSGKTINIKFEAVDSLNGEVYVEDNGVRISARLDEIMGSIEAQRLGRTAVIRVEYTVKIVSVDEIAGCVNCSVVDIKQSANKMFTAAIEDALVKNEKFCARARVVYVDIAGRKLIVDIAGVGIQGVIPQAEWSKAYTSSFKEIVFSGDIVPVVISGRTHVKGRAAYLCSRKLAVLEDSWENIEQRYHEGSMVEIKCLQRCRKYFFGSIKGLKDIEVLCEYPSKATDAKGNLLIIEEGKRYMGKIYRVSQEKKKLKARILYKIKDR